MISGRLIQHDAWAVNSVRHSQIEGSAEGESQHLGRAALTRDRHHDANASNLLSVL